MPNDMYINPLIISLKNSQQQNAIKNLAHGGVCVITKLM